MKRNFIALCALLLAACGSQEPKITLFSNEAFQTEADGKPVGIYTCLLYTSPSPRDCS